MNTVLAYLNPLLIRGYPKVNDIIMINGSYMGKLISKDLENCSIRFDNPNNLKNADIYSINPVSKAEVEELKIEKPHLFL